jgi:DNA replication and repair protein RecF
MRIVTTSLVGWRNYEQQSFEFTGSPTILLGANGQGKTNFVEALVYVALGRSHRTALDSVLVGSGRDHAIVRVVAEHAQRRLTVDIKVTASGGNEIRLNGVPTKRKDVVRLLPLVLFAPEDLEIIRGDPEQRRTFLADLATESAATQVADLAEYDRVLRQRNSLLKTIRMAHGDNSTLDTWTDSLVQVGARVMIARRRIVEALEPLASAQYSAISSSDDRLTLALAESIAPGTPDAGVPTALAAAFTAKRADEIERGTTLIGPHRDDLTISLNGLAARTHSSQGEAWSCALSLRLAMIDFLRARSAVGDPVVILDDVFAELDPERRTRLGKHVRGIEHLIITTADETTIPSDLTGVIHRVSKGRIDG